MKTTIKLAIAKSDKLLVSEGDHITPATVISEHYINLDSKILNISRILKVNEKVIHKYLKKKIGEEVKSGETIVEKKGWWSTVSLKSPLTGKINEVDLKAGTISITGLNSRVGQPLKIPIPGKVNRISTGFVEIEISAPMLTGDKGEGQEVIGKIIYFPGESVNIFDIDSQVENEIVLIKKIADDVLIKLEVLGATGVLAVKPALNMSLPYIRIDDDKFARLVHFKESRVWLRPLEKQIIIID